MVTVESAPRPETPASAAAAVIAALPHRGHRPWVDLTTPSPAGLHRPRCPECGRGELNGRASSSAREAAKVVRCGPERASDCLSKGARAASEGGAVMAGASEHWA